MILGRLYLQFRTDIFALGDRWRLVLYAAVGVIVVTLAASSRLFDTGAGSLAWFALARVRLTPSGTPPSQSRHTCV